MSGVSSWEKPRRPCDAARDERLQVNPTLANTVDRRPVVTYTGHGPRRSISDMPSLWISTVAGSPQIDALTLTSVGGTASSIHECCIDPGALEHDVGADAASQLQNPFLDTCQRIGRERGARQLESPFASGAWLSSLTVVLTRTP